METAPTGLLQLPEHRVQVERSWPLTRWEFLEILDLPRHDCLHSINDVDMGEHPVPVSVRVFIRPLEWVAPQVEDFRRPQLHKWFEPAHQLLSSLLHQHNLPVPHSDRQYVAVVTDVEKEFSGTLLRLTGEIG